MLLMINVSEWLLHATKQLEKEKVATARLDALVLLEDQLGKDRAYLLAHPELHIPIPDHEELENLLSRRAEHEPLAYIRGRSEFYGREFVITPDVLEPRPESETMIDMVKELVSAKSFSRILTREGAKDASKLRIADVGSGSGALGITVKLELKDVEVDLLEIDPSAMEVAKTNVDKFTLNISVLETDLLAQSAQNYHILLCNLPYVPDEHPINKAAQYEPVLAIFSGFDGLYQYRRLFSQAAKLDFQPLYILSEAFPPQHEQLKVEAAKQGYALRQTTDFIQLFELAV
jgi:release factor glutamine methyltransferase